MAEARSEYSDSDFSDEDLSPLDISFNKAADQLKKITNRLDNNQLLEVYGLFKQATEGVCSTPKPGWFDGRGRKKWDAWAALGELPQDDAKQKYIQLVQKYSPDADLSSPTEKGPKETWVAVSSLRHSPEPELDHENLSLLDAAKENMGDRVTELLNKDPELKHTKDEDGLTALHWAADRDATVALSAALKGGCLVDAVDETGQTALHYAAACGHALSTKILLEAGATMLKDEDGCTPLDMASDAEVKKILEGAT